MKNILSFTLLALTLAACSAPQGKKYAATNRELPPIALPPPESKAEIFESQQGQIVVLNPDGTLTVWLSSKPSTGYAWRLAEIPDPTVLKLLSKEYVPASKSGVGQEKWVFQAVGGGDVDLRLWYTSPRRERFGSAPVFKCVVSVDDQLPAVAQGSQSKVKRTHAKPRTAPRAQPKMHRTTPDPETTPFLEPVFRSSRVLLRDQRDGGQEQG